MWLILFIGSGQSTLVCVPHQPYPHPQYQVTATQGSSPHLIKLSLCLVGWKRIVEKNSICWLHKAKQFLSRSWQELANRRVGEPPAVFPLPCNFHLVRSPLCFEFLRRPPLISSTTHVRTLDAFLAGGFIELSYLSFAARQASGIMLLISQIYVRHFLWRLKCNQKQFVLEWRLKIHNFLVQCARAWGGEPPHLWLISRNIHKTSGFFLLLMELLGA